MCKKNVIILAGKRRGKCVGCCFLKHRNGGEEGKKERLIFFSLSLHILISRSIMAAAAAAAADEGKIASLNEKQ